MAYGIKQSDVAAIKAVTDNLPDSGSLSSLALIKAVTDLLPDSGALSDLATVLSAVDTEIAAIKAKTDNLPTDPADASVVAAAFTTTDALITTVDGVADAIKAKTDNLPTDPADQSLLLAEIQNSVTFLDFWSDHDDSVTLPAVAADTALPNVVVAGLPAGVSLVSVEVRLKVRVIENTAGGGANAIDGAQAIRVKKSTGSWGADDVAAIDLADNLWTVAASTRESGDVLIGDNDVKGEVDGNATYNFRFENALVDLASLVLNDVMVGLRIYFTTG